MKKILSLLALASLFATIANADIARVEAGAGMWNYKPSGNFVYIDPEVTTDGVYVNTSEKKAQASAYVWLLVKHPIPLLPNIRLEYTTLNDDGKGDGTYKGYKIVSNSTTELLFTQYDIIPYYNILDNTFWTTIDVGLDIKVIEYEYITHNVQPTLNPLGPLQDYTETGSSIAPLLYLRGRVEIPMTDIAFEADGKYISYDGDTVYDARVKVDYTLSFLPVVQPAVELGYRVQKLQVVTEDKTTDLDMEYSGVYFGIMAKF